MNKTEKIICLILGAALVWLLFNQNAASKRNQEEQAQVAQTNAVAEVAAPVVHEQTRIETPVVEAPKVEEVVETPKRPEEIVTLENDDVKLELSSYGAVVTKATLKKYAKNRGEISEENPAVTLDFTDAPIGKIEGLQGFATDFELVSANAEEAVFTNGVLTRTIALGSEYRILLKETFAEGVTGAHTVSMGAIRMGDSKNDSLSVDSFSLNAGKGNGAVIHHSDDDSPLKPYLVAGTAGGCSGPGDAKGLPETSSAAYPGAQNWIAAKNRFFVVALADSTQANEGFGATVSRDMTKATYSPTLLTASVKYPSVPQTRQFTFYAGPKKQAYLWGLGMKDVMEFGIWRWLCYPIVWILNFFHGLIPNYGIAIILLTIFVRLVFWPLTHKSTVGMKRMQELQPLMKEIQTKYKDNPQRLQQEMMALYREKKVNPMSSCLPMLIQIPVFIALFNVLRSAVELRYAPFLWIGDLSEPEALFASWFPFGGLNLLPILMAVTTALQSAFTPSTGDKNQQKMMMIFMPIMMLFMFYSFPSALSLYWFLSNIFSIVQMYLIRRQTSSKKQVLEPDQIIDPPMTRQQRRHA